MAANRAMRRSPGAYRGGRGLNAASGFFNRESTRPPHDGDARYPSRKRYANTKPRLLKREEMRQQELLEQRASASLFTSEVPPLSREGGGQVQHCAGASDEARSADGPSGGEQPAPTPRQEEEQWPHCRLVHVDLTDCDTLYLLSQRERLGRLDPKRKSIAMKRIQELIHEIEFDMAASSPTWPAGEE